jgi:putative membrane protein insertion efficiency factor
MMRKLLLGLVRAWQLTFGAWMGPTCRFHPSCSVYAAQALQKHGAVAGTYLAAVRIVRCGPWCEGGNDPVPLGKPRLFSHLHSPFSQKKNS